MARMSRTERRRQKIQARVKPYTEDDLFIYVEQKFLESDSDLKTSTDSDEYKFYDEETKATYYNFRPLPKKEKPERPKIIRKFDKKEHYEKLNKAKLQAQEYARQRAKEFKWELQEEDIEEMADMAEFTLVEGIEAANQYQT